MATTMNGSNGGVTVLPVVLSASSSLIKSGPFGASPYQSQVNYSSNPNSNVIQTNGPMLSLKVNIKDLNLSKTLQFQSNTVVFDALKMLREKIPEINTTNASNYGIFIPNSDPSKGTWLENNRSLEYYLLKSGDEIDYCNKFRQLKLRLLDGEARTLLVDDSQVVGQLMIYICSQIGIANYEEYSLIYDMPQSEKEKTLTLRRQHDKSLSRDFKKMEELKKKLHTEDDIAWLDHAKTLRQQSIDEESKLILKRKFFFSDKNIDTRDPVQLNLLYVQCRDAILNGTHPINEEMAIKFAAIQCQVRFGNHNEATHSKSGCLDLKEHLPKEYLKVKGIEKKILAEYKQNLSGLTDLEAKLKYTQLCRSLKTYGVTFFLVKEKMKGKNKLVARLLGITKESILRVDEKTKEFLNVYPLECVKKWAASPNTFTLDFGDHYKEPYYSMQTTEGEHIARLISGYIDIILKKKKAKEFTGMEADEEAEMIEEVVSPSKATLVQMNKTSMNQGVSGNVVMPGILRNGQLESGYSSGSFSQTNSSLNRQAHVGGAGVQSASSSQIEIQKVAEHHKPLVVTIRNARSVIQHSQASLGQQQQGHNDQNTHFNELGNDPASIQWKLNMLDVNRQNVTSHLSAMNAATAQVVTLTSNGPQQTDYNAVGAAVSCISTNLGDFSKDVMTISALQQSEPTVDPEPSRLTDAAKKLCGAFGDFLKYVEPDCSEPRQNLFSAVSKIGEAGNDVIKNLHSSPESASPNHNKNGPNEARLQDTFIGLAKTVASSTAGLVIASKTVANHCTNQQGVNNVISMVTQCALCTSQLVSCTKVCASTIGSKECQDQIIEAARQVSRQVDAVIQTANGNCQNEPALAELNRNARNVSDSVSQLLNSVKGSNEQLVAQHSQQIQAQDAFIERIFTATDNLFNCMGSAPDMIRAAKSLAQATTDLVNALKVQAHNQPTNEQQRKLLLAAKLLAEATSRMVECAKGCATQPQNPQLQSELHRAANDLKNATQAAAGNRTNHRLIKRLELCAKQAASCATQAIAAIQVCTLYHQQSNTNSPVDGQSMEQHQRMSQTHTQLIQQCKQVADQVPKIVQGIRGCMGASNISKSAHIGLINACEDFLAPSQKMILLTKAVQPTISDEIKAIQLRNCTNQLAGAIGELKACLAETSQLSGGFDAEAMRDSLQMLDRELSELTSLFNAGMMLKPLPGEDLETCEAQLAAASKTVGLSMAQMLTAAVQGNEQFTSVASKDTFTALSAFTNSIRAIVACSDPTNLQLQHKLVDSARQVLQQSIGLCDEAQHALLNPQDSAAHQQRLAHTARTIAQSLYACVNCLPGQNELDQVIGQVNETAQVLFDQTQLQPISAAENNQALTRPLQQIQIELNQSALVLNQSTNLLVIDSRKQPQQNGQQLRQSGHKFSNDFANFIQDGLQLVTHSNVTAQCRADLVKGLRDVHVCSSKLLSAVKTCVADPNATSGRQQLATSARQLTEAINASLDKCVERNSPVLLAQKECDNALRSIETTRTIMQANGNADQGELVIISEPPQLLRPNNNQAAALTTYSYYDCLDQIISKSKQLGESMTGIANSCKDPANPGLFCECIEVTTAAVCGLVETAAHSAYLLGVSDVESKRGRPQIIDLAQFIDGSHTLQETCHQLRSILLGGGHSAPDQKQQLIQAATQIAHSTASLCNASQQASARTNNILAKRHFVQSAKQVANATANFVKSIKSLDTAAYDQSEDQFQALVRPLLESVDSLCQYAMSPEFASVPAIISDAGARAQLPILSATRTMLDASQQLIIASRALIANNKDPHSWQSFSTNSRAISEAIKRLATSIKDKAPAKAECEHALSIIDKCMKHLESAILAVNMNQVLPLSELANSKSLQAYQEHAMSCALQLVELIDQVRDAAKGQAEKLSHLVTEISQYFEPLVVNVIGCAAKTPFNNQLQSAFLEQTKTVLESVTQLCLVAKEGPGNQRESSHLLLAIDENADGTKEALDDLVQTLEEASASNGYVASMVDTISRTIAQMDIDRNMTGEQSQQQLQMGNGQQQQVTFVECQTKIVQLTKSIQQTVKDMRLCEANELGQYAQQLTQLFNALIVASKGAIDRCGSIELASRIKVTTQDLGKVSIDLINLAGRLQNNPQDKTLLADLHEQIDCVNKRLLNMLHSFQKNAKGTQACINADNAVAGIIADLNTVIMFATSGTLGFTATDHASSSSSSQEQADTFSNHREAVLRTAKALVEDTKALVSTTGASHSIDQNQLAIGVQTSVKTITKLAEAVKLGAASLGADQPDAQVLLINAVKDVASALTDLISAIKITSNNNELDDEGADKDEMSEYSASLLRESAKNMVANVQSLLKTVKTVEDEAARGTRALESAIEAIYQEIKLYSNFIASSESQLKLTNEEDQRGLIENISTRPDDLVKATKQITMSTSKAIGAANSLRQEDVIAAANMGRKAVSDLLYVCRGGGVEGASTDNRLENDYQRQVLSVGLNCAIYYKELLESIQQILVHSHDGSGSSQEDGEERKQGLAGMSKNVSSAVGDILQIAEVLKGSNEGYAMAGDSDALTVVAESELLGAASAIESAAKKLSELQPRAKNQSTTENLNFDEQILEAAKSITNAAGVLIKAATSAQTELVAQGKIKPVTSEEEDGQWSQGLISAARMVAAACHSLCEAANGLVQGHATEDRLISSAKQVASSTAALLVACKVKAEITSQAMKRLQHAGNAVKRATDALVRAAQQAVEVVEEDQYLELNTKFVGSIAQEIMMREEILRKERELKAAQAAYNAVKKARYQRDENSPNSVSSSGQSTSTGSSGASAAGANSSSAASSQVSDKK